MSRIHASCRLPLVYGVTYGVLMGAAVTHRLYSSLHRTPSRDAGGMTTLVSANDRIGHRSERLRWPIYGMTADRSGNLFVADTYGNRIVRIDVEGTTVSVAGTGMPGYSGDGGPASAARLYHPRGVTVDRAGRLFIADTRNNRIRCVLPDGTIRTVLGTGRPGTADGSARHALVNRPDWVGCDAWGSLWFADSRSRRVRRLDRNGVVTTVFRGNTVYGLALDTAGCLYVADTVGHRVVRRTLAGDWEQVAGTGEARSFGDGGPGVRAGLIGPRGLAVGRRGEVYIADAWADRIREVDSNNEVRTVGGDSPQPVASAADPSPAAASGGIHGDDLSYPTALAVDAGGDLCIADSANRRIRRIDRVTRALPFRAQTVLDPSWPASGARPRPRGRHLSPRTRELCTLTSSHAITRPDRVSRP